MMPRDTAGAYPDCSTKLVRANAPSLKLSDNLERVSFVPLRYTTDTLAFYCSLGESRCFPCRFHDKGGSVLFLWSQASAITPSAHHPSSGYCRDFGLQVA